MPLGYIFRNTLEPREQWGRRMGVCIFVLALLATVGLGKDAWHFFFIKPGLAYICVGSLLMTWITPGAKSASRPVRILVGSLDERAYLRYGREYDQLNEAQQREILSRYRVGNYLFTLTPLVLTKDSFRNGKAQARKDAYRLLLWAVPAYTLLYAAIWFVRPGWTYWPTFLAAAAVTAFASPHLLWKWRQPDLKAKQRFHLPDWI